MRQALAAPLTDHRGAEATALALAGLEGLARLAGAAGPVALFVASGSGAAEAALVNTTSKDERVLVCEAGVFARRWGDIAARLGLDVVRLGANWRRGPDPTALEAELRGDRAHSIRAVLLVHCETSTGVMANVEACRRAIDEAAHPALLLVDAISSLGSNDYRQDEWGVDVTVGASQKGLMLPPGLSFNILSDRALEATRDRPCFSSYWAWSRALEALPEGRFPTTHATNMLRALAVALGLLEAEGLERVLQRHARHAAATRVAVHAWGLESYCLDSDTASGTLTAALVPAELSADAVRRQAESESGLVLGGGLDELRHRILRIGHVGDFDDLMLVGALAGTELALRAVGFVPASPGVDAAVACLAETARTVPA